MRESAKIVGLGVAAAVLYGEVQDQSLIRYCPSYFTVFHPHILDSDNVGLLAVCWGFIATWWVGLILGGALAGCAQGGERPPVGWRQLLPGLVSVFAGTAVVTAVAFFWASALGFEAPASVLGPVAGLDEETRRRASVMLAAYNASYLTAFFGGVVLCVCTWRRRDVPWPGAAR